MIQQLDSIKYYLLVTTMLLMAACATGPVTTPQTPAQQAAYMEATLTGLYNTAATLRPHLSTDKYKKVLDQLDSAKVALELAKAAVTSKSDTSIEMLQSLQKVLYALSAELTKAQAEADAKGAAK